MTRRLVSMLLSGFLLFGSIMSFLFLIVVIIQVEISDIIAFAVVAIGFMLIVLTAANNLNILINNKQHLAKFYLFNVFVCSLQTINIISNGFYFRYTQGLEWLFYIYIDNTTKAAEWGVMNPNLTHEIYFNFREANGFTFAVNWIAIALTVAYCNLYTHEKSKFSLLATDRRPSK
jgi:hypothetical protein